MKPLIVSFSDSLGGADRAAIRLVRALRESDIEAIMYVLRKNTDCFYVDTDNSIMERVTSVLKNIISSRIQCFQKTDNKVLHSANWFGSSLLKKINASDADLVNLHWCNAETLSIKQIAAIQKPIVMTLHDMWAFCGSEHYVNDDKTARFREGYTKNNRLKSDSGIDIDRKVWARKEKHWSKPLHIVTPSQWLSNCASESLLFKDWPVFTIPNALNINLYKPFDKKLCREILQLPQDIPLIGFGAIAGTRDPRKGFDLLVNALDRVCSSTQLLDAACVVVGQNKPEGKSMVEMPFYYMGHLYDDFSMMLFYNAIDVMVVPSRQENLPQTATEAQACGTPVVAFDCTGFPDAIEHGKTGYLAKAYDSEDLAIGIETILNDQNNYVQLQHNARARAVRLWSQQVVSNQYLELYRKVLSY